MIQLTQYERDNWNSSIIIKEIEFVIKKLPPKTSQGPDDFTEEWTPILHNLFQKREERILPNLFYKAETKPDKDHAKKGKLQVNITHEYRCKNP